MNPGPSALIDNEEAREFIRAHAQSDPYQISLRFKDSGGLPVSLLARQIESRQKARLKLPEWSARPEIIFPDPVNLQQASSEATARYKSSVFGGGPMADLTGGTGVDTCYLATDNLAENEFNHYVEPDPELCRLARHNFSVLQKNITVHQQSARAFLGEMPEGLRIFVDPSRRAESGQKVVLFEDCLPDVTALLPDLLKKTDRIMVKASPMIDIEAARRSLGYHVNEIHVLEWAGECREVLFLLDRNHHEDATVVAVVLDREQKFEFTLQGERSAEVRISSLEDWLYEPAPALMKAGGYKSLAVRFTLTKLHPNTHLFTSAVKQKEFPGRIFKVTDLRPYTLRNLKDMSDGGKANITTRNFPQTVASLRKRSGIRDGGDVYLFVFTAAGNQRMICRGEKPD